MKLLAIDYGTKNIGLAVSNKNGTIAFPFAVLQNNLQFLHILKKIIHDEEIEQVIIGVPHYRDDTAFFKHLQKFIVSLKKKLMVPIETYDELLSSQAAKKRLPSKDRHDVAAQIILEGYLDLQQ